MGGRADHGGAVGDVGMTTTFALMAALANVDVAGTRALALMVTLSPMRGKTCTVRMPWCVVMRWQRAPMETAITTVPTGWGM
jgi:hypothetical protein